MSWRSCASTKKEKTVNNKEGLMTVAEAAELIRSGKHLCVAGDEEALRQLPGGHWIGGTIPYFMAAEGGRSCRDQVFVNEIAVHAGAPRIRLYDEEALPQLCRNAPEHGYSLIIIPAFSAVHSSFACNAPGYEDMYLKPLFGWVSGVHLDDLGRLTPKVVNGESGEFSDTCAIVMDVPLPPEKMARIDIVNLFVPGDGDTIAFDETGFTIGRCRINGEPAVLAKYLQERGIDTRLPLVANYQGAMVNVSIKGLDAEAGRVDFYAPVFPGLDYKLAAPVADYVGAFRSALPQGDSGMSFSCNCILNYLYSGLEGKRTGNVTGPMTFGEIAYQLLNQTLAYLSIENCTA